MHAAGYCITYRGAMEGGERERETNEVSELCELIAELARSICTVVTQHHRDANRHAANI